MSLFWAGILVDYWVGYKKIPRLEKIKPNIDNVTLDQTTISIILAAKDEEKDVERTVLSLLAQEHIHVEIIAVNDRSSDRTPDILHRLSLDHARVKYVNIPHLPEGWLGKNHALHQGVKHASGEYYLFTDADILFEKDALAKAYGYLVQERADHVTAAPDLRADSFWLRGLISFFLFGFGYLKRPWTANQTNHKGGMGIGAFNLIRKECYESIGGHEAIRFRPDDDLELGQRVKRHGFKQRLITALDHLSVEWYPSLPAALRGFEKNAFAGLNYSVPLALVAISGVLLSQVAPFVLLFISPFEIQIISGVNILLLFCLYALTIRSLTMYSIVYVLGLPLFALLFVYMLTRALILTWIRGGIDWRGSRYSLKELKKHFKDSEED
ncbi:glycosyltransferase [Halobacillus locisalis]|uniref:Glycosyltransferase n=1 Tax=Halobacillus locisalis TaxID=220753 RepID=A0A838CP26_9BACI|nr:glycosyltransferase family 2 protein [Halobacillus locisalis]MBA2173691.1 glycosyltransferase [Halobacillus locisalis]